MSPTLVKDLEKSQKVAQNLAQLLADTYVLYLKTQNFHWNLVDERFYSLHKMFEKQYEELAEAVDEIAERIRTLHAKAPASMNQFLEMTRLEEAATDLKASVMLHQLIEDHTTIGEYLKSMIPETQNLKDEGTADLFIQRLKAHEKTAWMLRSHFHHE